MLGKRPKSEPVSVQLQGVTPTTGEIYFGIDTLEPTHRYSRVPGCFQEPHTGDRPGGGFALESVAGFIWNTRGTS